MYNASMNGAVMMSKTHFTTLHTIHSMNRVSFTYHFSVAGDSHVDGSFVLYAIDITVHTATSERHVVGNDPCAPVVGVHAARVERRLRLDR